MKTEIKQFKCRASASGKLMTKPRSKTATLSKTTTTYLEEYVKEQIYGVRKQFSNKYTEKGIYLEDEAIDNVIDWLDLPFAIKNEEQFEDDYFTGEPDLIVDGVVYDIKCSWDCFTFPLFDKSIPTKDYYYQLQVYMHLTGCKNAKLCYVLSDYEEFSIANYNHLGPNLRLKTFDIEYNEDVINELIDKVKECRIYINDNYELKK